jgi:DNA invertase Pin-like site-specific DNA recombinase
MNPKVAEHHRSRPAYVYLRQSTPNQVRHHQESTERQYALREKALELGWSESLIHTLDQDLGKTGTEMTAREDFKSLVAEVSMGQVGAVFALEVARLARSNLDWHRLLELCALTETLVIEASRSRRQKASTCTPNCVEMRSTCFVPTTTPANSSKSLRPCSKGC